MHIRDAVSGDHEVLLGVWRRAVEATHHFLTPAAVDGYEEQLRVALPRAAVRVATVPDDEVVGFAAGRGGEIDMLFVDPAVHGTGVGSALLDDAAARHPILTLDVNEQNPAARAWYRRRGFVETGRDEVDADGSPYPVIHLRLSVPPSSHTRPSRGVTMGDGGRTGSDQGER